jgi:hypothetical protein
MKSMHPFDTALAFVDPSTRRVTLDDIATLSRDKPLNVTLLNLPLAVSVDVCLSPGPQERVVVTPAPAYRGPQIVFTGSGVGEDGTLAPYLLGAEPCLCPRDAGDGTYWSPLGLALIWHPGIPSMIGRIARAFQDNIATMIDQYCEDGLQTLVACAPSNRRL